LFCHSANKFAVTGANKFANTVKMNHLSNDQHISQDLLLRYVEDDCSRLEMREIDRHLATCPMCSDAVEGLMLLSAPTVSVDNLNKRIDEKVAELTAEKVAETPMGTPVETPVLRPILTVVKRPFWRQSWAAAAAVLLLVSGSFWIFINTQKAENKAVASSETAVLPNSDTSINANTPPQYATAETAKNAAKTAAPIDVKTADKGIVVTATPSGIASAKTAESDVKFKDDLGKKQADGVGEKVILNAPKPSADIAVADNTSAKPAAPAPTSTYSTAPAYDRTQDYAGAANMNSVPRSETTTAAKPKMPSATKLEEKNDNVLQAESKSKAKEVVVTGASNAKKQMPSTPSVSSTSDQLLNLADLYFKQKYYETAATNYAQFINAETSGDRYERALFQLATCYVNMNRKADAKVIFQKIVGMNGQYERAAKKALKDL
jgi:tetratricopeptide (TPR) repeat protein